MMVVVLDSSFIYVVPVGSKVRECFDLANKTTCSWGGPADKPYRNDVLFSHSDGLSPETASSSTRVTQAVPRLAV